MGGGNGNAERREINININNNYHSFGNLNSNYDYSDDNNHHNEAIISKENFDKRFICKYSTGELNNFLKNILKEEKIQDSFFSKEELDDPVFYLLKQKELKDLSNFFRSNQSNMIDSLEDKINEILNDKIDYNDIAKDIFNIEKAGEIYKEKVKKEIVNIERNEHIFEIKYLTVMIVGKSGVGKSTLINSLLKLQGKDRAKVGTGDFVTKNIDCFQSQEFPLFKLVDTRGIELNYNYGAEAVKKAASDFINKQIKKNNPDDFVHCIWYCITGNRFEQVEIDLLNSLRSAYDNNSIPIIIIYTQATDNNAINGMQNYIKEKNINAEFIKILAERKELVNGQYLEPFGLDGLINETLKKCRQAMKGEMRSVMTNKISNNISNKIKEDNNYISNYIYESSAMKVISFKKEVLSDENFIKFIINLLGTNVEYFLGKNITEKSFNFFKKHDFINDKLSSYIKYYKDYTNKLILPFLNKCPIDFIDYQVLIQKKENKDIKIRNKRCLQEFCGTSKKFLEDNYYYLSQIRFIYFFTKNFLPKLTGAFKNISDSITDKEISKKEIQDLVSNCFSGKFGEFEKRVNKFFKDNNFRVNRNNDFSSQNFMNNGINLNNYNYNIINQSVDSLPNYSQINRSNNYNGENINYREQNNFGDYPGLN